SSLWEEKGDFHPWVEGKPLPMDLFRENARLWSGHFHPGWRAKIAHGTFLSQISTSAILERL
ncbi:hypothetical protein, partial [Geobacillus stearothermophilus]|uniref:hypothetical protein n=1 Tax=Geobacillus stearothermophilus TaxID=1422 RepID=UPI001E629473